jgi:hypothetical protein
MQFLRLPIPSKDLARPELRFSVGCAGKTAEGMPVTIIFAEVGNVTSKM